MPYATPGPAQSPANSVDSEASQLGNLLTRLDAASARVLSIDSRLNSVCLKLLGVGFSGKDSFESLSDPLSLSFLVSSLENTIFRIEESLNNLC